MKLNQTNQFKKAQRYINGETIYWKEFVEETKRLAEKEVAWNQEEYLKELNKKHKRGYNKP